ncbi:MAG TPA: ABC transporter transmembrane domain-containing protein, partial [Myxococcaceae bacterium]|nr:ABC transporter transmembrane domain-containing protein [Myxococcaceae bacterium]
MTPTAQTNDAAAPPVARTLRRLWRAAAPHRGLLYRAFACTAVLGAITGAYAYLMGPALRFLLTGGREGLLGPVTALLPGTDGVDSRLLLWGFPAAIAVLGLLKGLSYLGQFYLFGWFGQRVAADLRRALFIKLSTLSPTQRSVQLAGDLESRLTQDVVSVEVAATYSVGAYVRDGLQIIALVGVAFCLEWRAALAALVVLPAAAWPASRLTRLFLQKTRTAQAQTGALAGQIHEGVSGLRALQAFNAEGAESARFVRRSQLQRHVLTRAGWNRGAVPALMEVFSASVVAGVLAWAASSQGVS